MLEASQGVEPEGSDATIIDTKADLTRQKHVSSSMEAEDALEKAN